MRRYSEKKDEYEKEIFQSHKDYCVWVETYWDVRLGLSSTRIKDIDLKDLVSGLKKFVEFFSTNDFEYCHSVIERWIDQVQFINKENQIKILIQLFDILFQKNEKRWKNLILKILEKICYSLNFYCSQDFWESYQKQREAWIQQISYFDQFFQIGTINAAVRDTDAAKMIY